MMPSGGGRMCVACGRTIQWDANVCPYCGHDYRFPAQYGQQPEHISDGIKIVFYVLSFLFWIAGLIIGLVYYTKPDPESKHVGKICLILAAISVSLSVGLSLVFYIIILGSVFP